MKKKKKEKNKQEKKEADFEEVEVTCSSCGRKVKIIKVTGFDPSYFLCQKCSFGIEKPDEYL